MTSPGSTFTDGAFDVGKSRISNTIRRLRFDHDEMTQKRLAELVGVTRQTIVAIEKAHYSPSLELAFLIARTFDTPLEQVFTFEPEPPNTHPKNP
jgi:putative transcriptional regulator